MLLEVKIFIKYDAKKFCAASLIYTTWIFFYGWQSKILSVGEMDELTFFDIYFKLVFGNPIEKTCELIAQTVDSEVAAANKVNLKKIRGVRKIIDENLKEQRT